MALKFGYEYRLYEIPQGHFLMLDGELFLCEGDASPCIVTHTESSNVHADMWNYTPVIYVGSGDDLLEVIQSKLKGGAT